MCYFWDGSETAFAVARASARTIGVTVEKLDYSIIDVHDEKGLSAFLKTTYMDSVKMQEAIREDPIFKGFMEKVAGENKLKLYITKLLVTVDICNTRTYEYILNAMLLVKIAAWKASCGETSRKGAIMFIRRRRWFRHLRMEARQQGIELIALPPKININIRKIVRRLIPARYINTLRYLVSGRSKGDEKVYSLPPATQEPRIATDYYSHLNLERPECYSDLFFWQQSDLEGKDILMMFNSSDPLDRNKYDELSRHGVSAIALSPVASRLSIASVYSPQIRPARNTHIVQGRGLESAWLNEKHADYCWWRSYWADCFERFNVKLYTGWYKYNAQHMAMADAMQKLGGVTTIYQRSYESIPNPSTTVGVDIEFGFSRVAAEMERRNGSNILYHVTTGYYGDHRFPLLRAQAQKVRESLLKSGAEYIMAYFDENTVDDSRWYIGHEFTRRNYAFLLQKVLQDRRWGLVLKPKTPNSLKQRLGPVAKMLEEALSTGRCYLFSEGVIQGSYPPAAAAIAADVSVHDGISSATAGIESALCGIPTLILDQDGWPVSNLYDLGKGRVVFNDWESLWEACSDYRNSRDRIPGFGDWSLMLDEIDPFRDGRAAERIGTYLKIILDGFKAGLGREAAMADAADLYCRQWGNDKIVSIYSD